MKACYNASMRVGIGYDTHVLAEGKNLILGGVVVPYEMGFVAHSDGDVLVHAIMDSLLGAAGLRDIGHFFPNNNPKFKGADSMKLLSIVLEELRKSFSLVNVDAVLLCEKPKLAPYLKDMEDNVSNLTNCPVGVKATTTEGMNAEGKGLCISAQAICLIKNKGETL